MFVLIHTLATFIVALIATRPQDGELILFFVLGSIQLASTTIYVAYTPDQALGGHLSVISSDHRGLVTESNPQRHGRDDVPVPRHSSSSYGHTLHSRKDYRPP
jgi:hypothetical protein